jgi:hypothetical protein
VNNFRAAPDSTECNIADLIVGYRNRNGLFSICEQEAAHRMFFGRLSAAEGVEPGVIAALVQ